MTQRVISPMLLTAASSMTPISAAIKFDADTLAAEYSISTKFDAGYSVKTTFGVKTDANNRDNNDNKQTNKNSSSVKIENNEQSWEEKVKNAMDEVGDAIEMLGKATLYVIEETLDILTKIIFPFGPIPIPI